MKRLIMLILLFSYIYTFAQQDYYEKTFDWAVNIFEENDAGYEAMIARKGEDAYKAGNIKFRKKIKNIKNDTDFSHLMYSWCKSVRKGHLYFFSNSNSNHFEQEISDENKRRKDSLKTNITEQEYLSSLNSKSVLHPLESIWWDAAGFRIGFVPDKEIEGGFNGVIFTVPPKDSLYWDKGDIIMQLTPYEDNPMRYHIRMYDRIRNQVKADRMEFLVGDKTLFGIIPAKSLWEKEGIKRHKRPSELYEYYAFIGHRKLFIKRLSDKTTYLYINSFDGRNKNAIDEFITNNDSILSSSENLIIDIRNCTGGSTDSFSSLMPFIQTGITRQLPIRFKATELYAQYIKSLREKAISENDSSMVGYTDFITREMENKKDGFFYPFSDKPYEIKFRNETLTFPKKIGIITHGYNASTDEHFLRLCKQSFKTKIFGHTTYGALDVANMIDIKSPDGKFILGIAISIDIGTEDFPIDDIGIQPDFYIDPFIERFGWIDYVQQVLEY